MSCLFCLELLPFTNLPFSAPSPYLNTHPGAYSIVAKRERKQQSNQISISKEAVLNICAWIL